MKRRINMSDIDLWLNFIGIILLASPIIIIFICGIIAIVYTVNTGYLIALLILVLIIRKIKIIPVK